MDINYNKCFVCKKLVDDGGMKNDKFVCHDCLDSIDSVKRSIINEMSDKDY